MRFWSRTLSGRLCRVSSSSLENMVEEDNQSLHNENNENKFNESFVYLDRLIEVE